MLKDGEAKEILGTAEFMRDMIRTWIPMPWARHVEVVDMQLLPADLVSRVQADEGVLTHRYGDVAWMVGIRSGEDPADGPGAVPGPRKVLVLVEAQDRAMRAMPQRMLEYVSLAMGRMLDKTGRIEPILPVVVYTGIRRWTAPLETTDLVENVELVPPELIPFMRYILLDLGQLDLPEAEDSARQNLATEVVRVLTRTPVAELTTALGRIMMLSSERGEDHAADAIAGRLALALARRHGRPPRKLKVDSMASLMSETEQWNYPPGAGDLQRLLEEERALREEEQQLREEEQQLRQKEQQLREEEQQLRQKEQQLREEEQQSRRTFLVSLLRRLDPATDEDSLANLSVNDLEERVDDRLGD